MVELQKLPYRSNFMNGGFLITKIKQLGDRIFQRILNEKGVDAFNGPQGRILYTLWQEDGVPIKTISDKCGLAITTLTTMLERMEKQELIHRQPDEKDKRKTLIVLTEKARGLESDYHAVSDQMGRLYYKGFSASEIEQFEAFLERVRDNLEEAL